jgi:hypothetical protein
MSATHVARTSGADEAAVRPLHVNVLEEELTELRRRIEGTKWPERETANGRVATGTSWPSRPVHDDPDGADPLRERVCVPFLERRLS